MPPVIRFKKYLFIFFAFCAGILHCSCSHDRLSYLYTGLHEHKNEQKDLVALFEKEDEPQIRFAIIDKIAAHLQAEHKIKSLAVFLQSVIDAEPDNPYNGYFLLRLAAAYRDVQEDAIAAYWNRWFANLLHLLGYGYLVAFPLIKINLSPSLGMVFSALLALSAFIYGMVVVIRQRSAVRLAFRRTSASMAAPLTNSPFLSTASPSTTHRQATTRPISLSILLTSSASRCSKARLLVC